VCCVVEEESRWVLPRALALVGGHGRASDREFDERQADWRLQWLNEGLEFMDWLVSFLLQQTGAQDQPQTCAHHPTTPHHAHAPAQACRAQAALAARRLTWMLDATVKALRAHETRRASTITERSLVFHAEGASTLLPRLNGAAAVGAGHRMAGLDRALLGLLHQTSHLAAKLVFLGAAHPESRESDESPEARGHQGLGLGSEPERQSHGWRAGVDSEEVVGAESVKRAEKEAGEDWLKSLYVSLDECSKLAHPLVACLAIRSLLHFDRLLGQDKLEARSRMSSSLDVEHLAARVWLALDVPEAEELAAEVLVLLHAFDAPACRSVVSRALLPPPHQRGHGAHEEVEERERGIGRFERLWNGACRLDASLPLSAAALGSGCKGGKGGARWVAGGVAVHALLVHGLLVCLDGLSTSPARLGCGPQHAGHHEDVVRRRAQRFLVGALRQDVRQVLDPLLLIALSVAESTLSLIDVERVTDAMKRISLLVSTSQHAMHASTPFLVRLSDAILEADNKWVRVMTQELSSVRVGTHTSAKYGGRAALDAMARARAGVGGVLVSPPSSGGTKEGEGVGGEGVGASARKQTVNQLWLSQHVQAGRTVEHLPGESDYMEGLVRIAARSIHVCCHVLSSREAAPLISAAASVIKAVLGSESRQQLRAAQHAGGPTGSGRAMHLVSMIALPILERLEAALVAQDATCQATLLDLVQHMLSAAHPVLIQAPDMPLPVSIQQPSPAEGAVGAAGVPGVHGGGVVGTVGGCETLGALGVSRQLFLRILLAGIEDEDAGDGSVSLAWIHLVISCVDYNWRWGFRQERLDLFLIPVLTSLCKRLVRAGPCSEAARVTPGTGPSNLHTPVALEGVRTAGSVYGDDQGTHHVLALLQAVEAIFRQSIQAAGGGGALGGNYAGSSAVRSGLVRPDMHLPPRGASWSGSLGWIMYGGGKSSDEGAASLDDGCMETLLKLLAPPGWIPEAAGTSSVLAALLSVWGPTCPAPWAAGAGDKGRPAAGVGWRCWGEEEDKRRRWENQGRLRRGLLDLLRWLVSVYPLQTTAAFVQVWDAHTSPAVFRPDALPPRPHPAVSHADLFAASATDTRAVGAGDQSGRTRARGSVGVPARGLPLLCVWLIEVLVLLALELPSHDVNESVLCHASDLVVQVCVRVHACVRVCVCSCVPACILPGCQLTKE
jgi:hypothetical protein